MVKRLNSINKSQDFISKKLGMGRSTFWRLNNGKEISTTNFFKIITWLDNGIEKYIIHDKICRKSNNKSDEQI